MPKTNVDPRDAELAALRAELEQAKAAAANASVKRLTFKVSEKRALSVYGLGRFPVTLYREQWERLIAPATVDALRGFISANSGALAVRE